MCKWNVHLQIAPMLDSFFVYSIHTFDEILVNCISFLIQLTMPMLFFDYSTAMQFIFTKIILDLYLNNYFALVIKSFSITSYLTCFHQIELQKHVEMRIQSVFITSIAVMRSRVAQIWNSQTDRNRQTVENGLIKQAVTENVCNRITCVPGGNQNLSYLRHVSNVKLLACFQPF